jgi:hypothetical protein
MTFNSAVFERLLFPLHRRVYRDIQEKLDEVERKHPGLLKRIIADFSGAARSDTQTATWRPGKADEAAYPSLDISIVYNPTFDHKISWLHKARDYQIIFYCEEKPPSRFTGSHLSLGFYRNKILNAFIVPLEYLIGFNEKAVLLEGSYQLYSHNILPLDKNKVFAGQIDAVTKTQDYSKLLSTQRYFQNSALVYVGITKKTWQHRYRQHCSDSQRGSNLLFHRALRGEMGAIGVIEHIVERAGLTERQAMEIEEKEVEKRSLHSLYPNGLNMIPGGYAGLKCIHHFAARTGFVMKRELTADTVESILVEVQRHTFEKHFKTAVMERVNAEIARLWAEDIGYRVSVMTNRQNRLSYRQIQAARIWYASGWLTEKILENLRKLDSREISEEQLERFLRGETYASIPEVLM